MTLRLIPASFDEIRDLRSAYLASLPEPQEFHCERLSQGGQPLLLSEETGAFAGYAILGGTGRLLELHPADASDVSLLDRLVAQSGIGSVLCKSFDTWLYDACAKRGAPSTTRGLLYRRLVAAAPSGKLAARLGRQADIPAILAQDDGFFRDAAEAESYLGAGELHVYESGSELVGCGLIHPVVPEINACDIGMVVVPAERRRGHGREILLHLIRICTEAGNQPIAGCSIDNLASRRCLESAGFRSEHRLVEFAL